MVSGQLSPSRRAREGEKRAKAMRWVAERGEMWGGMPGGACERSPEITVDAGVYQENVVQLGAK